MSSPNSAVYHESYYQHGKWKDGAWYCNHKFKAAERTAINSKSMAYNGLKCQYFQVLMSGVSFINTPSSVWVCVSQPTCRFYLWEDHVVEALKYFKAPEEDIVKMTPKKRKRDAEITMYFPITPKTPRTRNAEAEANSSEEDIYELSDRETSRSGRHRGRFFHASRRC